MSTAAELTGQPVGRPARQQLPAEQPVTAYLPQGGFGHAVAHRLASKRDIVLPVDDGLTDAAVPYADRLVLIADPDRITLRKALDDLSFTRGLPSVGLELSPTELRCGPLVVPGRTACYRCYDRRRRQHGRTPVPETLEALEQGYAHHHVVIGAGLVMLALDVLDRDPADGTAGASDVDELGGRVWTVDLVAGATSLARTVATDRCETCSARYAARRSGTEELAHLLPSRRKEAVRRG